MGDSHMGLQARLMSQAMRKLTSRIGKTNTIVIFINQLREKIGIAYGNPEVTPGGRALKYFSSVRIEVRRVESIKSGSEVIGNRTKAKVVKNKVAPPFKEAEFDILFGQGISKMGELVDLGVLSGIITKSGAWFSYGEMRLGQGRDNVREYFKENPELASEIEQKVYRAVKEAQDKGVNLLSSGKKAAKGKTIAAVEGADKAAAAGKRSGNIDIDADD